jgi:hypothetical protein
MDSSFSASKGITTGQRKLAQISPQNGYMAIIGRTFPIAGNPPKNNANE